tara:strand:+ start:271 stop:738 length:468 start_codon:yes stop_codon:yes gene_type:complete
MDKEVLLTDAQFIEGFAGAFGQILSYHIFNDIVFKDSDSKNFNIILGLSFLTTWLFRKIFMNIYSELKLNLNMGLFYSPSFLNYKKTTETDKNINRRKFFIGILVFFVILSLLGNYTAHRPINTQSIYIFVGFVILYYLIIFHAPERKLEDHDMY